MSEWTGIIWLKAYFSVETFSGVVNPRKY